MSGVRSASSTLGRTLVHAGAVAYRELLSLFVTPLAYVVGTLFLLLQGYNFVLLLRVLNHPLAAPGPVMQYFFGGSFFIFWLPVVFLCAAISMRLVAEERKQGTFEALLTAPISPSAVVLGKFAGAFVFYVALWLPTGIFYVLLRGAAVTPDPGPIAAGYLGTLMVGASFLAIGLLASAFSRSQLGAAISTFVACSILLLSGLLVDQVQEVGLAQLLETTSLLAMMQEMAQGIVDQRWFWIHGALVVSALSVAVVAVNPRRTAEHWMRAGLVVVLAVHAAWWGTRHAERGDWTAGDVYSLSERARTILGELDDPVEVRVVVPSTLGAGRPNPVARELREVLQRMTDVSSALRVRVLDPDRDRQEAEQWVADFDLGGRQLADGVVLIRAGQGASLRKAHLLPSELVTFATGPEVQATGPRVKAFRGEEALLGAFLQVTNPTTHRVCATTGHGEPAFDNLEPYGGYAHLRDLMVDAGLELRTADLTEAQGLEGCDVVLVAGPSGALPSAQVEAITRYAQSGGDLLLLTGAVILRGSKVVASHGLEGLTARYGIRFGGRIVLSPQTMPMEPLLGITVTEGWGDHPAVETLVGRPVSFVLVRELELEPTPSATPVPLVSVGDGAWAEADLARLQVGEPPTFDESEDRRGPIPLAAASELGGSKLVVIASDAFALNAYLREDVAYDHGRDLILNVLGWLTGRDTLLGIRPKEREHIKLVLRPEQLQRMTWVCLGGMPGFAVLLGLWVLWRRRK